jgi:hypothetical protein
MFRIPAGVNRNKVRMEQKNDNSLQYEALNSEINILVRLIDFKLDFRDPKKENLQLLEKVSYKN